MSEISFSKLSQVLIRETIKAIKKEKILCETFLERRVKLKRYEKELMDLFVTKKIGFKILVK